MPLGAALRKPQVRARVILMALAACFLAVAAKLFFLVLTEQTYYRQMLVRNWNGVRTVYAKRGSIESRNGVALVFDQTVARVVFEPKYSDAPYMSVCRAAEALNKDYAALWRKVLVDLDRSYANPPNAVLADSLPADLGLLIQQMHISGVTVQFHYVTVSPYGPRMASHTIGAVGTVGRDPKGLEKAYDCELKGRNGLIEGDIDSYRSFLPGSAYIPADSEPRDGKNVVTTIHEDVQAVVESELDKTFAETGADWATVIVQEVSTGEVWAVASRPAFDPNLYNKHEASGWRPDPMIATAFEPGSVIKPLVVAGLLDKGYVSPRYQAYCGSGIVLPDGKRIREAHDSTAYGLLTLEGIIVQSSNIGMAQVARLVGQSAMEEVFSAYNFFRPTGLGLPDEVCGTYPAYYTYDARLHRIPHAKWPLSSLMNAGFGQGFSVTPLQLSTAYCTLANMGRRVTPKLVLAVEDQESGVPFPVRDDATQSQTPVPAPVKGAAAPAKPQDGFFDRLLDRILKRQDGTPAAPKPESEYVQSSKWEKPVKVVDRSKATDVHIVDVAAAREHKTYDEDGTQVLKPATCRRVLGWMEHVVDSGRGTGKAARMESYRVAGKTGTAQVGTGRGGYLQGVYTASFVGILPAENPRFVILAVVGHPRGGKYYGSQVAAPLFKRVADRVTCLLKIPQSVKRSPPVKLASISRSAAKTASALGKKTAVPAGKPKQAKKR